MTTSPAALSNLSYSVFLADVRFLRAPSTISFFLAIITESRRGSRGSRSW